MNITDFIDKTAGKACWTAVPLSVTNRLLGYKSKNQNIKSSKNRKLKTKKLGKKKKIQKKIISCIMRKEKKLLSVTSSLLTEP